MRKFLLFLPLVFLWACNQNDVVKIEGTITNANGKTLYLDKLHISNTELLDSVKLDKKGHFKFKIPATQPEFQLLRLSNGKILTLLTEPGQQIKIITNGNKMSLDYDVKGSMGSQLVKELNQQLLETKRGISSIRKEAKEKQGDPNFSKIAQKLNKDFQKVLEQQRQYSSDFILKNATSLASYMALYQKIDANNYTLNENKDIKYVKIVASSMKALYPNSEYTKALLNNLDEMQKRLTNMKIQNLIDQVGTNYPEIDLPNTKDKNIKLTSLKGKFTILVFWSARDPKASQVNKTLKKIYARYHSRGLDIYQVSVDQNKLLWKSAIKRDGLTWTNVCDPKNGSSLAASTYNVKQVPTIYLISKKGEIVGKNLFGKNLEDKVGEFLK